MLSPGLMTTELGFSRRPVSGRGGAVLAGGLGGGGAGANPPPLPILNGGGDEGGPDEGGPDEGGPGLFVGFTRKVAVPLTCPRPRLMVTEAVTACGPALAAGLGRAASGPEPAGVISQEAP